MGRKINLPDRFLLSVIAAFRFVPAIKRDLKFMLNSFKMEGTGKTRAFYSLPHLLFSTSLDRAELLAMSFKVRNIDVERVQHNPEKGIADAIFLFITLFPIILTLIL